MGTGTGAVSCAAVAGFQIEIGTPTPIAPAKLPALSPLPLAGLAVLLGFVGFGRLRWASSGTRGMLLRDIELPAPE